MKALKALTLAIVTLSFLGCGNMDQTQYEPSQDEEDEETLYYTEEKTIEFEYFRRNSRGHEVDAVIDLPDKPTEVTVTVMDPSEMVVTRLTWSIVEEPSGELVRRYRVLSHCNNGQQLEECPEDQYESGLRDLSETDEPQSYTFTMEGEVFITGTSNGYNEIYLSWKQEIE